MAVKYSLDFFLLTRSIHAFHSLSLQATYPFGASTAGGRPPQVTTQIMDTRTYLDSTFATLQTLFNGPVLPLQSL